MSSGLRIFACICWAILVPFEYVLRQISCIPGFSLSSYVIKWSFIFNSWPPSFCSSDSRITGMIYHVWMYMKFLSEAIIWYEFDRRTNVFIKWSLFSFLLSLFPPQRTWYSDIYSQRQHQNLMPWFSYSLQKKKWTILTKKEKRKKEIHRGIKKSIHTYTWISKSMFNAHMYTYEIQEDPIFYSTQFLDITCKPDSTLTVRKCSTADSIL